MQPFNFLTEIALSRPLSSLTPPGLSPFAFRCLPSSPTLCLSPKLFFSPPPHPSPHSPCILSLAPPLFPNISQLAEDLQWSQTYLATCGRLLPFCAAARRGEPFGPYLAHWRQVVGISEGRWQIGWEGSDGLKGKIPLAQSRPRDDDVASQVVLLFCPCSW